MTTSMDIVLDLLLLLLSELCESACMCSFRVTWCMSNSKALLLTSERLMPRQLFHQQSPSASG
jgi:hypothetical protein